MIASTTFRSRASRGLSMMEVLLAVLILAGCTLVMLYASLTSSKATTETAEYAAAVAGARKKMEEICSTPFDQIVVRYGVNSPTVGRTFKVYLNEGLQYKTGLNGKTIGMELQGLYKKTNANTTNNSTYDAGEIVIVTHESNPASGYGYSCGMSPTDNRPDLGKPGGISFQAIPIDLDGDGTTTNGDCYIVTGTTPVKTAVRLPVGVVVRWQGISGPERYELWTIVTNY